MCYYVPLNRGSLSTSPCSPSCSGTPHPLLLSPQYRKPPPRPAHRSQASALFCKQRRVVCKQNQTDLATNHRAPNKDRKLQTFAKLLQQLVGVFQGSKVNENLRQSVVSKHGDAGDVLKTAIPLSFQHTPRVCHKDLGSFVKGNPFPL